LLSYENSSSFPTSRTAAVHHPLVSTTFASLFHQLSATRDIEMPKNPEQNGEANKEKKNLAQHACNPGRKNTFHHLNSFAPVPGQ
jgi:hypothetical protein